MIDYFSFAFALDFFGVRKHYFFKIFFDPLGRPTVPVVIIISHVVYVRPFAPTFQNLAKQNNFQVRIVMIAIGGTLGMAEGIIDDTCLVFRYIS